MKNGRTKNDSSGNCAAENEKANAAKERVENEKKSAEEIEKAYIQMFKKMRKERAEDGGIFPKSSDFYALQLIDTSLEEIDDERENLIKDVVDHFVSPDCLS